MANEESKSWFNAPRGQDNTQNELGLFANGGDFETMTSELKDRFQKYLRLIFTDLCAKDNGLNTRAFGLYTF